MSTEIAIAAIENWTQCLLPRVYRQLLPNFKNEITGIQVALYPVDLVIERNETYQTKIYCPGYISIGDDSGGRAVVISLTDPECHVFLVDHASMDFDDFEPLNIKLNEWLGAKCPVD